MPGCRVRSTTAFGGGGSSLPRGHGIVDPCRATLRLQFADLVLVTSERRRLRLCDCRGARWWPARLGWRGFPCGASMLGIVWGCGWVCSGEILVGSFDTDAVPPSGDIIPSWRASWLPIHSPRVPGETLGPACWSGQQGLVSFLKVMLGT